MIWTAAEDYSFRPVFMAFDREGKADLYLNSVIGWTHKWYGGGSLEALPRAFEGAALQDLYDTVYWLCMETCVYEQEREDRPAVPELRREYARRILRDSGSDGEQELAVTLRNAHFGKALGVRTVLLPKEQRLVRDMDMKGKLTEAEVEDRIRMILREYFHFRCDVPEEGIGTGRRRHFRRGKLFLKKPAVRFMITRLDDPEEDYEEEAGEEKDKDPGKKNGKKPGEKEGEGKEGRTGRLGNFLGELWEAGRDEWSREYIETCFGSPVYHVRELQRIESLLCTGSHEGCHLYFTKGERRITAGSGSPRGRLEKEAQGRQRIALEQEKKNREYYEAHRDVHQNCILRLKEQIANTLLIEQEPESVTARMGKLNGRRGWRERCLGDMRVFDREIINDTAPFSVDIMLDGSASQLHRQEMIASQGYIIAESLRLCRIPVQVYSFCSFCGYTVFNILREYKDRDGNRDMFRYSACGWNRDGLALRGAGYLMEQSQYPNRLLIILTDASPNDDKKIPSQGVWFKKTEYEAETGIRDAADEVRKLKKKGIRVIGVFYGLDQELEGARKIYGSSFVRIRDAGQLADTVGGLIREEVRRMEESCQ